MALPIGIGVQSHSRDIALLPSHHPQCCGQLVLERVANSSDVQSVCRNQIDRVQEV